MKIVKNILFKLFSENFVKHIYYRIFHQNLVSAHDLYIKIDEHSKYEHIMEAINYARVAGLPPVYFGFGCHSGRTFSAALRAFNYFRIKEAKAYAFDSFQGLPQVNPELDGIFRTGSFSTNLIEFRRAVKKMSGVNFKNYYTISGFYEYSLNAEYSKGLNSPGVIHIDVDLYSSAVTVLDYLKDKLVPGAVILFDDWYCFNVNNSSGERKAAEEFFARNTQWELKPWKSYSSFGQSFFIVQRNPDLGSGQ